MQTSHAQIFPTVLCGGSGTRMWPLSRKGYPKQFLKLLSDQSLLQDTIARFQSFNNEAIELMPPILVSSESHRFIVKEQFQQVCSAKPLLILEPKGKNTAPALTLAALAALEESSDPVLVVTPADHIITNLDQFKSAILKAIKQANNNSIVVLGIKPTAPETGYGYIKIEPNDGVCALSVKEFVEKPDLVTAEKYLLDGSYYWNAGIFVLKAKIWLEALSSFHPDMLEAVKKSWQNKSEDGSFVRPSLDEFSKVVPDSVDYAVLEKCSNSPFNLKMVPMAVGWSDLGAWEAVWEASQKDDENNVLVGDVIIKESNGNLAISENRLIALVGVENLVVIETSDAVLIADKSQSQNVKAIVSQLDQNDRTEHNLHRKVLRPWGWYDSIDMGKRFQVKRIGVKPGASLSLQLHHHRAEHWIVVQGTAEVTKGKEIFILKENESTYIPQGELHRLRNPGKVELEIIEVQSGSYLGEDDIVRLEDTYGRA